MNSKLPSWFKQNIPDNKTFELMYLFSEFDVNTVCQKAKCPNISRCFRNKKFTFMILGDTCTRNCKFCNVGDRGDAVPFKPFPFKTEPSLFQESYKIRELVKILDLDYVIITSVTRDDLYDGGAAVFAKTIELIHEVNKDIKVEVLIPDFCGKILSLECILDARPDVVAHNIETIKRLYSDLRPMANYQISLNILSKIKELKPDIITKSSIMLGLGETEEEAISAMRDLKAVQCDILTLGQYLAPSASHYPVREYVALEQFKKYQDIGLCMGFRSVLSGPLVRSSYQAEDVYKELLYA